jgi:phosphoglycerol transferase MdoB-like AlkP superfamily enzyme
MKKTLLLLSFIICLFLASSVLAQTRPRIESPILTTSFQEMVDRIGSWIFTLALGVVPLMVLIGVFIIVTSSGDPAKANVGRKVIFYALIGFLIIAAGRGIIALFRIILGI